MTEPSARVGGVARALGFAGLLPQLFAVGLLLLARSGSDDAFLWHGAAVTLAFLYAALILSFLGGIWWGFAMRRTAGQGALAVAAVTPSLVALALAAIIAITGRMDWSLAGLGIAIVLTLPVDRRLVATGEAPAGWMTLRVPLSVGLGALTILAGVLATGPATVG